MTLDTDGIESVLSLGDVRYAVVRPHRGMKDGFEVINAWNEKQIQEFRPDERDAAIEHARSYVERNDSFDRVLVTYPARGHDE